MTAVKKIGSALLIAAAAVGIGLALALFMAVRYWLVGAA